MSLRQHFTPREYTPLIWNHIAQHPRCGVWAGMGMGKTSATLFTIAADSLSEGRVLRTLVLGPLRVAKNVWPSEVLKWHGLQNIRVSAIVGTATERTAALKCDADVYVMNYENIPWLMSVLEGAWPFERVVADESTKLKGLRSSWQRHKTSGKVFYREGGGVRTAALGRVAHQSDYWINLTGTPSPNGLQDLWGQTWFLDGGKRLGNSYTSFTNRWFRQRPGTSAEAAVFEPMPGAEEEIIAAVRDLHITLDPYDWFDIDRPNFVKVPVVLDKKLMAQYKQLHQDSVLRLGAEKTINAVNAGVLISKCLQFASGAVFDENRQVHHIHDAKLEACDSVIEELCGAPVIIVYAFTHELARLRKAYPKGKVLDDRKETEDAWNRGDIPVLFVNPQSAAHGLNLQVGGHNMIFFSSTFNLELFQQVIERIGPVRQAQAGLKRIVNVFTLEAVGTWDEQVSVRLDNKDSLQERVKAGMKMYQ